MTSSSSSRPRSLTITALNTLPSPSQSRSWHSTPHPNPTIPLLATSTSDRTILIHNLRSRKLHSTIQGGHKRSVRSCSWRPSSSSSTRKHAAAAARKKRGPPLVLASGSFDATAGIWRYVDSGGNWEEEDDENDGDVDEGWKFEVLLEGHDSEIKSVAWNRSGRLLATCSRDKSVWIWEDINYNNNNNNADDDDDGDYETIAVLQEHEADVKCVAWHPTEDVLVSGSYDDDIRIYREDQDDEWRCVCVLKGHESTVWCVVFEPPGAASASASTSRANHHHELRLASASADRTIRLWRRLSAQQQMSHLRGKYPSTFISREEEEDHAGEEEWDEECLLPAAHEGAVYSLSWSKTGRIVSTGEDGRVVVYEEERRRSSSSGQQTNGAEDRMDDDDAGEREGRSQWVIIARLEAAHGVWEVNCVCWWGEEKKRERRRGAVEDEEGEEKEHEEEIIITTGDDGLVKMWSLLVDAQRQRNERMEKQVQELTEREGGNVDGLS